MRFTQKMFANWLRSKHPRTKVGVSCKEGSCPLAKAMTQKFGVPMAIDGTDYGTCKDFSILEKEQGFEKRKVAVYRLNSCKHWMTMFIECIDASGQPKSVSANKALKILRGVTKKSL